MLFKYVFEILTFYFAHLLHYLGVFKIQTCLNVILFTNSQISQILTEMYFKITQEF